MYMYKTECICINYTLSTNMIILDEKIKEKALCRPMKIMDILNLFALYKHVPYVLLYNRLLLS
jgi:hypothetical protein